MRLTILSVLPFAAALLLCNPFTCDAQQSRWAVVNVSSNFLRDAPDYEAGNGTQLLMGTVVEVLESDGIWRKVTSPDPYVGWTNDLTLAYMDESEKDEYIASDKWICGVEHSHVYEEPDMRSSIICNLTMGDLLRQTPDTTAAVSGVKSWYKHFVVPSVTGEDPSRGWVKNGGIPWIRVMLPDGKYGWVPAHDLRDFNRWAYSRECKGENIVKLAKRFLGVPYMWGGNTANYFDCSGLTKFVYFMNGVLLPRNCSQQVKLGEEVPAIMNAMRPGDLVFFGTKASEGKPAKASHVGIYIGDGKMIHSSQLVRINSLVKSEPGYYDREILCVRRVIGHIDDGTGAASLWHSPWYFKQ